MRDYGKVYTAFWTSEDSRAFSEDARTLALYLLTCQHGNMLGCFRLSNAYAADDLQWDSERVSKGFAELFEKGFAYRCERTYYVFIRQYLKWNQFENPNVGKAAEKLLDVLTPPDHVKSMLVAALREFSRFFPVEKLNQLESILEPFENPFETIREPFRNTFETISKTRTRTRASTRAGTKPEPERASPRGDDYPTEFEEVWAAYPKRPGASKKDSYKAWSARIKAGATAAEIMAGVLAYTSYVIAKQTDPEFIKQPATFFGPDEHFRSDWTVWAQARGSPRNLNKQEQLELKNREIAERLSREMSDE